MPINLLTFIEDKVQFSMGKGFGAATTDQEAKVIALGTGKLDDEGKKVAFTVKVGDTVLISKYGGTEVKLDGTPYMIMREDDILGIIG